MINNSRVEENILPVNRSFVLSDVRLCKANVYKLG